MGKKKKWPVDYTKHPVYQAWEVTAHRTGNLICQMLTLKENKWSPYRFYKVMYCIPEEACWQELGYYDFFSKIMEYERACIESGYDRLERYNSGAPLYNVRQVIGPETGEEFPDYNNVRQLIEACKVCDINYMPLFLSIIYKDSNGEIKKEIAHPGDKNFVDLFSEEYLWERRLLTCPPTDGSIKQVWIKENIYGCPGKCCANCCKDSPGHSSSCGRSFGGSMRGIEWTTEDEVNAHFYGR